MRKDVAQFIARNHRTPQQEVEEDIAAYREASLTERLRDLVLVCRSSTKMLAANPHPARILRATEPPHPSYAGIMHRLRQHSETPTE